MFRKGKGSRFFFCGEEGEEGGDLAAETGQAAYVRDLGQERGQPGGRRKAGGQVFQGGCQMRGLEQGQQKEGQQALAKDASAGRRGRSQFAWIGHALRLRIGNR
jgi:hypothetical protein